MAESRNREKGKLEFVEQILTRDPKANEETVNAAWQSAGHPGRISRSSIGMVKAKLGLTDPTRSRFKAKSKSDAPRRAAPPEPLPTADAGDRGRVQEDLEMEFDRILFRVMGLGDLPEVEDLIRRAAGS